MPIRAAASGSRRGGLAAAAGRWVPGRGRAGLRASPRRPTTASGPSCSTGHWARDRSAGRHRRRAFVCATSAQPRRASGVGPRRLGSRPPIMLISRVARVDCRSTVHCSSPGISMCTDHGPGPGDVDIALHSVVRGRRAEIACATLLSGRRGVERPVARRVAVPHRHVRRRESRRREMSHRQVMAVGEGQAHDSESDEPLVVAGR